MKLEVEPGTKVRLSDFDPADHGKHDTPESAAEELAKGLKKIDRLQYLMYSENKRSLLVVLQGMDTAGKDGVIRHVMTAMNPQGCTVTRFHRPSEEEAAHDFLWRVHPNAPRRGSIAVFNRSHYEDVLVVRVHGNIKEKECAGRYERINEFERLLRKENGTTVIKFFLHVSKEEQLARFKQRLDDPDRRWKISEADYAEREHWDEYVKAYEAAIENTSTKHAPWFIIPSDHKWFRNLAVSRILIETLEGLKMKPPEPTVDLAKIRRQYHEASAKAPK